MIGETLGSYLIEQALGSGGMGEVFLGVHRRIGRRVAVKLLMPEYSGSQALLGRFFTEAKATSVINHPGIVQILDCDFHPSGRAYIIMEYLHGESLRTALERVKSLSHDLRAVVDIVSQVADAVGAAHAKGIIHRDLKPDNVFLLPSDDGRILVKILDFGVAKLLVREGPEVASRTRTGSLLGTPLYMSPEQCQSAGTVDHRSDIYSLGCIFFEMVCGRPPFEGPGVTDLLIAHASHAPKTPRGLGIDIPAETEALMLRMLAKEPDDRPSSMAEVSTALRAMVSGMPRTTLPFQVQPPPLPEVRTMAMPANYSTPRPPYATPPHTTLAQSTGTLDSPVAPRRRRGALIVLTTLGLAGVAAYFAFGDRLVPSLGRFIGVAPDSKPPVQPAESAEGKSAANSQPAPPPPPVEAPPVTIDVDRAPAGLQLLVDGQRAQLPLKLPRDGAAHRLDFRAPGYEPESRMIEASQSQILKLSLKKVERPIDRSSKPRRRKSNMPPAIINI